MDGDLVGSSVGFVLGDFVNMNGPFLSLDLDDLALAALASTSQDDDLIVLADREGSHSVLGSQSLGKGGRHDSVPDVRGSRKMSSSLLSSAAANLNVSLHLVNYLWRKY